MDDIPSYYYFIAIGLIILSMLFSISESAFLGMNKLRLRLKRKNKDKKALRVGKLLDKKEQLINTLLISNDLVNIFLFELLFHDVLEYMVVDNFLHILLYFHYEILTYYSSSILLSMRYIKLHE